MAERENSVWGKIRVQLSDVQNYLLNGRYREAVILDKEILALLVRMQIDQALMVSSNLEGDINQLYDGRVISAQARDAYHGIRAFGEMAEMGNNPSAQDANDSFSMLRDALSSYMDESQDGRERKTESTIAKVRADSYGSEAPKLRAEGYPDRKTVSVAIQEEDDGALGIPIRRNSEKQQGRTDKSSSAGIKRVKTGQRTASGQRRVAARTGGSQRKAKKSTRREIDLYSILQIALPVAILLVVILLIRLFVFKGRKTVVETTAALTTIAETMESTEAESTVEETTEAAKRYFVTTGVRVRTKPSTTDSETLTVLDSGTEIQYKGDYDSEWVIVNYNGQDAYISKQYVRSEEVESSASSSNSAMAGPGQNLSTNTVTSTESSASNNGSTTLTVAP